jgi:glycerate kinase
MVPHPGEFATVSFLIARKPGAADNSAVPLRVLIIPDKFKGTLTAREAADAIAKGWRKVRYGDALELLPMSDGGDGFGEVIGSQIGAKPQRVRTADAAHRPCRATWWWEPKSRTAIIEAAEVIGLMRLPPGGFHPFALDTYGLGKVLHAATDKGATRCVIGIGGSATNDGGFGLARALGWEFLDRGGQAITKWTQLDTLAQVRRPSRVRWFRSLVIAVDVRNPLLGPMGCTCIYGPQKGLHSGDFAHAERCLRRLAAVMKAEGHDHALKPGAGAAGGLGFGLRAFVGGEFEPGFDAFARYSGLAKRLRTADLVLTGEGAVDRQTLMGKGVGELAQWCRGRRVPCVALAGTAAMRGNHGPFTGVHLLTDLATVRQAMSRPAHWLRRLAMRVAEDWPSMEVARKRAAR